MPNAKESTIRPSFVVIQNGAVQPVPKLTPAEARVLNALRSGMKDAEIAASLGISHQTVRNHLHIIYSRYGVHGRKKLKAYISGLENKSVPAPPTTSRSRAVVLP